MEPSTIIFLSAIGLAALGLVILLIRGNKSRVHVKPETNTPRPEVSPAPQSAYGKYVHNIPAPSFREHVGDESERLKRQLTTDYERPQDDGVLTAVIVTAAILSQDGVDQPVDLVEEPISHQEYEAPSHDYSEPSVPDSTFESDSTSMSPTD